MMTLPDMITAGAHHVRRCTHCPVTLDIDTDVAPVLADALTRSMAGRPVSQMSEPASAERSFEVMHAISAEARQSGLTDNNPRGGACRLHRRTLGAFEPSAIVLDPSTLVSATFNSHGVSAQAVRKAVLYRLGQARFVRPERRSELLGQLVRLGIPFERVERVTHCRDEKDNKYLESAITAGAERIVSSDASLLVLYPLARRRHPAPSRVFSEGQQ